MKRKVLPLSALLLLASLSSCAPTLQGPAGAYRPRTQIGVGMLAVQRVPVSALNEATPNTAYVEFPDCFNVVVSVEDVRKLGVEPAREACQETSRNVMRGTGTLLGALAVGGAILGYFVVKLFITLFSGIT
ncbi:hypothetical protein E5F05_18600 [Deinococcus metallilatus]|uniref:Uncharacterized protein n=1 Tax=Deinococcus metallilatus TaxID=1211322 RepID=A0AAJ5F2S5_9DEIO|nr:hypothetical protein [Deinococcus metallilatus]MBB5296183.1 hypothetical protein [Deinococcus metallilatus]QBY09769.1 hypothetical protein E5F05_18600 [Deinococcus metallilatus]RXJ08967.1 hypothetical protein ERJ73_17435 [Deinococcus metallilatus]TLK23654.1 hypothetical protein FCS05_15645 [Deinococcus metallilatus]GMA14049.1 hypothetical protein GCM10025871_03800 [Deinococcus metallilatus]